MSDVPNLLGPADPPAFEYVNANGRSPLLFVSDHHGGAVPASLDHLGLPAAWFNEHIGRDIGIDMVGSYLSRRFDAPLVRATYSRLVVDCNRSPSDETAMPEASDGVPIPGNQSLGPDARSARIGQIHQAYHGAIAAQLADMTARGPAPIVVALHSFTPRMDGFERPWEIAILWDKDAELAQAMLAALGTVEGLCVGDNEPYSARSPAGHTIPIHAESAGLAHVSVEIRQDLITDAKGAGRYAEMFGDALKISLGDRLGAHQQVA
jgi:predicted N-formylglutamate amidohydrolase